MYDSAKEKDGDIGQWLKIVEWCRRNPLKVATIYALDADERDRIKAALVTANGGFAAPLNVEVSIRPSDFKDPINVRF